MDPTCSVIEDGYTRVGYLEARENLHDALAFTYRPLLPADVDEADAEMQKLSPRKSMAYRSEVIAKHLETWSECERGADGKPDPNKPRPITAANVARLNYKLLADLRWVVWGIAASDPIPNPTGDESSELFRALQAEAQGKPAGLVTLQEQQGN